MCEFPCLWSPAASLAAFNRNGTFPACPSECYKNQWSGVRAMGRLLCEHISPPRPPINSPGLLGNVIVDMAALYSVPMRSWIELFCYSSLGHNTGKARPEETRTASRCLCGASIPSCVLCTDENAAGSLGEEPSSLKLWLNSSRHFLYIFLKST